ncbi:hypothetical protein JK358_08650 [Nocardia sp. 2]|uniref:Tr-type G domain-containing protein n=1 Tax=Nocardia acididurans TaxID=2802282 RepID=A0ABS1M1Q2_9NOCA|nr:hypothetical protein [Nocardia acididurans]MBL1074465.1 hypothetical protein [Nocardia acididurans]
MGPKAIDPQAIRNVTLIGDPDELAPLTRRLRQRAGASATPSQLVIPWAAGRVEHTIRVSDFPAHAPIAALERAIRLADGVIAVVNAANPRLDAILRVADDHQTARLCLLTALDHPAADVDHCLRTITETRGAVPLTLHLPLGAGPTFEGVIDLLPMWSLAPIAAEMYGSHWQLAEHRYHDLVATVQEQDTPAAHPDDIPLDRLHTRIRHLTRIGDIVPILCSATPRGDDIPPLLDAIVRYLPSPLDVCQPEHALDY